MPPLHEPVPSKVELPATAPELVTALVPSLSRSLSEQFNVFRVMRHGTHEKQLSNVFAWLLDPEGTHELGNAAQGLFLDLINEHLPAEDHLPRFGYGVAQEVITPGHEGLPNPESLISPTSCCPLRVRRSSSRTTARPTGTATTITATSRSAAPGTATRWSRCSASATRCTSSATAGSRQS